VRAPKFDAQAADWSSSAYADASRYLARRAQAIATIGPPLATGDAVLDLACGDGGLAAFLPRGVRYLGVDASETMVATARAHGRDVVHGDLNSFVPSEDVDVTTCFRAIYYADDRRSFFTRVRGYTRKKLVFDVNPRQYRLADVRADAHAAGFPRFEVRPFFVPQTHALPGVAVRLLQVLEGSGPLARAILRARFTYVCSASS
jgi:SAM-dependent methyltransferase